MIDHRFKKIASHISRKSTVADIGTDQGILPVEAIRMRACPFVIATECRPKPLHRARLYAQKEKCDQQIDFRLGDGLEVIQPCEAETIVVAGMGANNIIQILKGNEKVLQCARQLILVPHFAPWLVRAWGENSNFYLGAEDLIYQRKDRFYEILVYYPGKKSVGLNDKDILFGPYLRQQKSLQIQRYYKKRYEEQYTHCCNLIKSGSLEKIERAHQLMALWKKEVSYDNS